jgi:nucleotide-binding universal stress UspA family protein
MFQTIVVPLNGWESAERALPFARALAEREGARLLLVMDEEFEVGEPTATYLKRKLTECGPDSTYRVTRHHNPVEALVEALDEQKSPLVVMASHGRGGITRAILGSVAEETLARVGQPMLLLGPSVPPTDAPTFETLLVCSDGSTAADSVIPVVQEWSDDLASKTVALEVVDPKVMAAARDRGEDVVDSATIAQFAARLDPDADWEVLHGDDPARVIASYATGVPGAVIAVATHGRTGIPRYTVGSTAAEIVHDAPCPVLVVPSALLPAAQ